MLNVLCGSTTGGGWPPLLAVLRVWPAQSSLWSIAVSTPPHPHSHQTPRHHGLRSTGNSPVSLQVSSQSHPPQWKVTWSSSPAPAQPSRSVEWKKAFLLLMELQVLSDSETTEHLQGQVMINEVIVRQRVISQATTKSQALPPKDQMKTWYWDF